MGAVGSPTPRVVIVNIMPTKQIQFYTHGKTEGFRRQNSKSDTFCKVHKKIM